MKNKVEQDGIRAAHDRDGKAVTDTINWIKSTPSITEKDIAEKLISERAKNNLFRGTSFDSIVGFNANGAKIHGNPTDTKIKGNGLLLIDSGGQYDDGTTDITRTIAIGTPTDEMREKYTLVLKAHIALATAIFPAGTTGIQLDAICRAPLWAAGIDFAHGTGHGVGYFLNVHEGPCGISPRSGEPLSEGQLLSNEPGYYEQGAFGIRLENLMLVQKYMDKDDPQNKTGKDLLCFETVTKVPFDEDCIIWEMLSEKERGWLESYQKLSAEPSDGFD
jgi:Xaa-Pro aminopeptidase